VTGSGVTAWGRGAAASVRGLVSTTRSVAAGTDGVLAVDLLEPHTTQTTQLPSTSDPSTSSAMAIAAPALEPAGRSAGHGGTVMPCARAAATRMAAPSHLMWTVPSPV